MRPFEATILPAPDLLKDHVECFRIAEYRGDEPLAINVSVNGLPGIVFQHAGGHSPIERITTPSHSRDSAPTLYLYGQITEPSVMKHKAGPYTLTQVLLKPHALRTLLGLNASVVTGQVVALDEFAAQELNDQLLEATHPHERVAMITHFLVAKLQEQKGRDPLVEESLRLIHHNFASVSVKSLREQLNISERHFERRFRETVGVPPQLYLRVMRFKAAVRLMKARCFGTLTDVAHALNYHDQSHFIRDMKAFSGVTPKDFSHRLEDVEPEQRVLAYV